MGELITNDADSYRYLADNPHAPNQETLEAWCEAGLATKYFNLTGICCAAPGYRLMKRR